MAISIKNLNYKYHNNQDNTLKQINLEIASGTWVSIVGHNGSGKSTLMKILSTLLPFEQGQIVVDDLDYHLADINDVRRLFGVVFQNPDNQFVGTTVFDDVAFGLQNLGLPKQEIYYRVDKYLELVKMKEFKLREPHTLSGGQKQRVAIASCLALEPKYIIFDEATSMLDPVGRREILSLMKYIASLDLTTIIAITHDLEEAILGDKIVTLNSGEIVYDGVVSGISEHVRLFNDAGVLVPFALQVSTDLIAKGVNIKQCVYESELIDQLCKLNLKM